MTKPFSIERLPDLIAEAKRERLFGKIVFEFNDGDLKLLRKESTYKVSYSPEEDHSNVHTIHRR